MLLALCPACDDMYICVYKYIHIHTDTHLVNIWANEQLRELIADPRISKMLNHGLYSASHEAAMVVYKTLKARQKEALNPRQSKPQLSTAFALAHYLCLLG